jgi:hypothetical protein
MSPNAGNVENGAKHFAQVRRLKLIDLGARREGPHHLPFTLQEAVCMTRRRSRILSASGFGQVRHWFRSVTQPN